MGVDLHELRRRSVLGQHCSNDVGNMLELSWWCVFPRGRLGVHELRSWHMVERHPGYFLGNLYRLLTWDDIDKSWRDNYLLRLCAWPIPNSFWADVVQPLHCGELLLRKWLCSRRGMHNGKILSSVSLYLLQLRSR